MNFTGESSRAVFDRSIQSSPDGKIIIHATPNRAEAAEERHGRGGAFTLSLLASALELKTNIPYGPVGIKELLPNVKKILLSENYEQTPTIAYETGDLRVPFLIDTDQITIEDKKAETDYRKEAVPVQPTYKFSFTELALAGLVVFAIVKAFQD